MNGNKFLLVVIDGFSRWPEAFPLPDQKAYTVARAFYEGIVCRHAKPRVLVTDRGSNFTSQMMKEVMAYLGVKQLFATPYHNETTGMVERMNQTLENVLQFYIAQDPRNWDKYIPSTLFAIRTAVNASTGKTPFLSHVST